MVAAEMPALTAAADRTVDDIFAGPCCLSRLKKDVIVVAQDLLPSDVATIDRVHVKGIITEKGATNSHAVVLAKSYGIPMITGVTDATKVIADGSQIEMDGATGNITVG